MITNFASGSRGLLIAKRGFVIFAPQGMDESGPLEEQLLRINHAADVFRELSRIVVERDSPPPCVLAIRAEPRTQVLVFGELAVTIDGVSHNASLVETGLELNLDPPFTVECGEVPPDCGYQLTHGVVPASAIRVCASGPSPDSSEAAPIDTDLFAESRSTSPGSKEPPSEAHPFQFDDVDVGGWDPLQGPDVTDIDAHLQNIGSHEPQSELTDDDSPSQSGDFTDTHPGESPEHWNPTDHSAEETSLELEIPTNSPAEGDVTLSPPTQAIAPTNLLAPSVPTASGLLCASEHLNPPGSSRCFQCGTPIELGTPTQEGPQPALGTVTFDDGQIYAVDSNIVVGRNPGHGSLVETHRPIVIRGDQVSRNHWRIDLSEWNVVLYDCGSTNGTDVQIAGTPPVTVPPSGLSLTDGTTIYFGDRNGVFRSSLL